MLQHCTMYFYLTYDWFDKVTEKKHCVWGSSPVPNNSATLARQGLGEAIPEHVHAEH